MSADGRAWRIERVVNSSLLVVGVLAVMWLVWRSLEWPLVHDAPLMHYVAWRIGEGAVPYRDVFDMNFPGVYVMHLLVVRLLGDGDLAWRMFDLGWLALTAALIGVLVAPWGRAAAAGAALLFALYHLAGGAWQAGQRDFLLCAFLLAGALGVARWLEAPPGARARALLACGGLALGAATTLKPHALVLAAALGALVAVAVRRATDGVEARRATDGVPVSLGVFIAGVALAPAAVLAWLGAAGALPAWRAIVLEYLVPLYSRLGPTAGWSLYRPEAWIALGAGIVISLASVIGARRFGARHAVAALGALYGVVHFAAQAKGWEYHLYPLAAFTLVLLFAGLDPALARPRMAMLLLLAALAGGALLAAKAAEASPAHWEREKADRARRLAGELAPRLAPGDTVQVLDTTGGGIHALLRLRVREPTRFIYDFHFFHDRGHPTIEALRDELTRGLDARPPRLIVLFEEGWPGGGYERLDAFVALRERLAGYDLVRPGPGYRIYAQRHRS